MSYLALYRKYRPNTFDEVIGQDHITKTLVNQIKTNQLSHAYLFTGTRGVGKTTIARIFAQAVNCKNNVDGNPCKKCENCLNPNNVDIVELDAASNNGVDQAREIREKVAYLPANSKYKVYIIDEVHMLSSGAFNALLKTLEEPPEYVIFILCTTESQKIPATILSRCMRFDFHLLSIADLVGLLTKVLDDVKVSYTLDAVTAVAVMGEGSARDSLSILDRCVAVCEGNLTYEGVINIFGATNTQTLFEFANAVISNDVKQILTIIDKLVYSGKSINVLAKDLCQHFRNMLVAKTCDNANEILSLPLDRFEKLVENAKNVEVDKLLQAIGVYASLDSQLRYSLEPRLLFESATLILSSGSQMTMKSLEMRIKQIESRLSNGVSIKQNENVKPQVNLEQGQRNFEKAKPVWVSVLSEVRERRDLVLLSAVLQQIKNVWCEDNVLVVSCDPTQYRLVSDKENHNFINGVINKYNFSLKLIKQESNVTQDGIAQLEKITGGNIEII